MPILPRHWVPEHCLARTSVTPFLKNIQNAAYPNQRAEEHHTNGSAGEAEVYKEEDPRNHCCLTEQYVRERKRHKNSNNPRAACNSTTTSTMRLRHNTAANASVGGRAS